MTKSPQDIDWSQLWYPGPKRAYTADEMARAGGDAPTRTLVTVVAANYASLAFVALQMAPASQTARLTAFLAALAVLGSAAARWLWWRPWRRPLMQASVAVALSIILFALLSRSRIPQREERQAVGMIVALGCSAVIVGLWFLVTWRSQTIDARLREQAEREKAIEMARRLAAAQIEPHFLFNTLASVQHWVQTRDERAAPLLAALTGYLRATLPLFDKPLLRAGDELQAVQRYLEVMQARLGEARLVWRIDADDAARAALIPPGLLLTLVENAVAHGVEPLLSGGRVMLRAARQGDAVVFEVLDNGPGLAAGHAEGTGLANVRQRLALAGGQRAGLTLQNAPGGGCRAEIRLPHQTEEPAR